MKRKTDRLLARVPDITIRNRSEVEAEEFGDDLSDDADSDIQRLSRKVSWKGYNAKLEADFHGAISRRLGSISIRRPWKAKRMAT